MTIAVFTKIEQKLRKTIVHYTRNKSFYPYLYKSYWHYLFHKNETGSNTSCYYSARPNPGAGIGHQIANWIAGYWFAQQFRLKFAHIPFSTKKWDDFLGFGYGNPQVEDLKKKGYIIRRLPLFDEKNNAEILLNKRIIQSYEGKRVVFVAEQDQFYHDQFGVIEYIRKKFYSAPSRKNDRLTYSPDNFNIAIHVRRGDILTDPNNPNLTMRYLSNDYFEKVLKQVVDNIKVNKPIHIYFFSQGKPEDYPEFASYPNLHWCLEMGAQDSFLHFVYADLLITSKSSFSYKPALLSYGIKVCPRDFWHGYPQGKDWILCDNNGRFDVTQLNS